MVTCEGPKLESEPLYLYSCITSPQPWFKLLCQSRASTQGVKISKTKHSKKYSEYLKIFKYSSQPHSSRLGLQAKEAEVMFFWHQFEKHSHIQTVNLFWQFSNQQLLLLRLEKHDKRISSSTQNVCEYSNKTVFYSITHTNIKLYFL